MSLGLHLRHRLILRQTASETADSSYKILDNDSIDFLEDIYGRGASRAMLTIISVQHEVSRDQRPLNTDLASTPLVI